MGFITSSIEDSIKNWNHEIGDYDNKQHSMGIYVNKYSKSFRIYWKEDYNRKLTYISTENYKKNDKFMLSFNFGDDKVTIHHNDTLADTFSLANNKMIIPAFSLRSQEEIEIIKWKLYS